MANVITRTDLENLKRDADDIGLIANANDTTVVTTRLGRQVKSAAKAIKDLENTTTPVLNAYINKAQAWAENPENTPVETGKYSALHWAAKAEEQAGFAATAGNYIGDYPTTPAANKGEVVSYTIGGFKHYFQSLIDNNTNTPALVSSYWFCRTNAGALGGKTLEQIIPPYSNPLEAYASTDPAGALGGGLLIGSLSGTDKWFGGVLAPNGKIYGIPFNATQILEFDPSTGTINLIGSLSGTNKWTGGVLAPNGKIYGIPYNATQILEFDPSTGTINLIGSLSGGYKWMGGVLAPNGKIYGIPLNVTQILGIPYGNHGNQWWALSAYTNKL